MELTRGSSWKKIVNNKVDHSEMEESPSLCLDAATISPAWGSVVKCPDCTS